MQIRNETNFFRFFLYVLFGAASLFLFFVGNNAEPLTIALGYALCSAGLHPALCALLAAALIEDGRIDEFVQARYASYRETEIGKKILSDSTSLEELSAYAEKLGNAALPGSGKQERLESIVNNVLFG